MDSDVISISSEESCRKRSTRSTNKARSASRKRNVTTRKRPAGTYHPEMTRAKKSKQVFPASCHTYPDPNSTFLPITSATLTHRRKKTVPVKYISAVEDKQRALVTKKNEYIQVPQRTFQFAARFKSSSERGASDDLNLRRSSRFSSDVPAVGKSSSKLLYEMANDKRLIAYFDRGSCAAFSQFTFSSHWCLGI